MRFSVFVFTLVTISDHFAVCQQFGNINPGAPIQHNSIINDELLSGIRYTFIPANPFAPIRTVASVLKSNIGTDATIQMHLIWIANPDFSQTPAGQHLINGIEKFLYSLSGSDFIQVSTSFGLTLPSITLVDHFYPDTGKIPSQSITSDATLLYYLLSKSLVPQQAQGNLFIILRNPSYTDPTGDSWYGTLQYGASSAQYVWASINLPGSDGPILPCKTIMGPQSGCAGPVNQVADLLTRTYVNVLSERNSQRLAGGWGGGLDYCSNIHPVLYSQALSWGVSKEDNSNLSMIASPFATPGLNSSVQVNETSVTWTRLQTFGNYSLDLGNNQLYWVNGIWHAFNQSGRVKTLAEAYGGYCSFGLTESIDEAAQWYPPTSLPPAMNVVIFWIGDIPLDVQVKTLGFIMELSNSTYFQAIQSLLDVSGQPWTIINSVRNFTIPASAVSHMKWDDNAPFKQNVPPFGGFNRQSFNWQFLQSGSSNGPLLNYERDTIVIMVTGENLPMSSAICSNYDFHFPGPLDPPFYPFPTVHIHPSSCANFSSAPSNMNYILESELIRALATASIFPNPNIQSGINTTYFTSANTSKPIRLTNKPASADGNCNLYNVLWPQELDEILSIVDDDSQGLCSGFYYGSQQLTPGTIVQTTTSDRPNETNLAMLNTASASTVYVSATTQAGLPYYATSTAIPTIATSATTPDSSWLFALVLSLFFGASGAIVAGAILCVRRRKVGQDYEDFGEQQDSGLEIQVVDSSSLEYDTIIDCTSPSKKKENAGVTSSSRTLYSIPEIDTARESHFSSAPIKYEQSQKAIPGLEEIAATPLLSQPPINLSTLRLEQSDRSATWGSIPPIYELEELEFEKCSARDTGILIQPTTSSDAGNLSEHRTLPPILPQNHVSSKRKSSFPLIPSYFKHQSKKALRTSPYVHESDRIYPISRSVSDFTICHTSRFSSGERFGTYFDFKPIENSVIPSKEHMIRTIQSVRSKMNESSSTFIDFGLCASISSPSTDALSIPSLKDTSKKSKLYSLQKRKLLSPESMTPNFGTDRTATSLKHIREIRSTSVSPLPRKVHLAESLFHIRSAASTQSNEASVNSCRPPAPQPSEKSLGPATSKEYGEGQFFKKLDLNEIMSNEIKLRSEELVVLDDVEDEGMGKR